MTIMHLKTPKASYLYPRRLDHSRTKTKPNICILPINLSPGNSRHIHPIPILQPDPLLPSARLERLRTAFRNFQKTGKGFGFRSGDGAGAEHVPWLDVTARNSMMREHLPKSRLEDVSSWDDE